MTTYIDITTDTPPNYLDGDNDTAAPAPATAKLPAPDWAGLRLYSIAFGNVSLTTSTPYASEYPDTLRDLRTLARILDAIAGPPPDTD